MIIIGDADVLIALFLEEDSHYEEASKISKYLYSEGHTVIFPNTAIAEAITTLHRKLANPTVADLLVQHYKKGLFEVEYVDEYIMQEAAEIYNPKGSKKNTFFDALVAATAKKLNAQTIFSFDTWYQKLGFKLASDL
ncbi:MAG: type II toxin-antitoxin system VapC family toxin [Candidatus Levybacteria bacterium]|nr:type II toxin-antitoxin system VapC family toxin [Candidatus Levybacteria bacterium]